MAFQVSFKLPSLSLILLEKYALLSPMFRLLTSFLRRLYASIRIAEPVFIADFFSLSLDLARALRSEVIQGQYFSETLRCRIGACFSIIDDNRLVHFSTADHVMVT